MPMRSHRCPQRTLQSATGRACAATASFSCLPVNISAAMIEKHLTAWQSIQSTGRRKIAQVHHEPDSGGPGIVAQPESPVKLHRQEPSLVLANVRLDRVLRHERSNVLIPRNRNLCVPAKAAEPRDGRVPRRAPGRLKKSESESQRIADSVKITRWITWQNGCTRDRDSRSLLPE